MKTTTQYTYYLNQAGNGFNVFRGSTIQTGQGIGSFLGGLARSAMPLVKSFAGKALKTGLSFAKDAMAGGDLKKCPKTCQDCRAA